MYEGIWVLKYGHIPGPGVTQYQTLLLLLLLLLSHVSRVWLWDPMDGNPPGSPVPGILQARTLEWVAISFSNAWKWKVKVKLLSHVRVFATPWTAAHQVPPSMGFSRQEYWSGSPVPSPSIRHSGCLKTLPSTLVRRRFLLLRCFLLFFWETKNLKVNSFLF